MKYEITQTKNTTLTLETGYEKYGNSTDLQIDTLSMAVCGSDWNGIYENSLKFLDENEEYAIENYSYETDFLASLTKAEAKQYIEDPQGYQEALDTFKSDLQDKARNRELDEQHPLVVAIDNARDDAHKQLQKEWIYGDYYSAGLLRDASRKYGVEFTYDEKADVLTFDIEAGELQDIVEYENIEETPEAVSQYIANRIECDAYTEHEKNKTRRVANRENWETRKRIQDENDARKEAERVEKLKAITD